MPNEALCNSARAANLASCAGTGPIRGRERQSLLPGVTTRSRRDHTQLAQLQLGSTRRKIILPSCPTSPTRPSPPNQPSTRPPPRGRDGDSSRMHPSRAPARPRTRLESARNNAESARDALAEPLYRSTSSSSRPVDKQTAQARHSSAFPPVRPAPGRACRAHRRVPRPRRAVAPAHCQPRRPSLSASALSPSSLR